MQPIRIRIPQPRCAELTEFPLDWRAADPVGDWLAFLVAITR